MIFFFLLKNHVLSRSRLSKNWKNFFSIFLSVCTWHTHNHWVWFIRKYRRYPKFAFFSDSARYQRKKKIYFCIENGVLEFFFSFDVDSKPFLRILSFFLWKTFHWSWRYVYLLTTQQDILCFFCLQNLEGGMDSFLGCQGVNHFKYFIIKYPEHFDIKKKLKHPSNSK